MSGSHRAEARGIDLGQIMERAYPVSILVGAGGRSVWMGDGGGDELRFLSDLSG